MHARQILHLLILTFICIHGNVSFAEEIPVRDSTTSFANRVSLSTERPGMLADVPKEGTRIKPDQLVIRLKDDVPLANLRLANARAEGESDIRIAEKAAAAAAAEYDAAVAANRISSSNPAYPPTHMTRLKLDAEAAKLKIAKAQHEQTLNKLAAEQASAELRTYHVIAREGGMVTRIFKHPGEVIQQGEAIVQVVNTDVLRVEGYVKVTDVDKIRVGMPVRVTFQVPGDRSMKPSKPYSGKLGYVDVSVQEVSENVFVWAEIDNREAQLREGLTATMVIITD